MTNAEFVSTIAVPLKMVSKDDYISRRTILRTGRTISEKIIAQKIQRRTIDREASLFKEIQCIEFEPEDVFKCEHVEFRLCKELSKSKKNLEKLGLVYTQYGSSIQQLYSIDRLSTRFTEGTLLQLRNDMDRAGYLPEDNNKFYILNNHIYVPRNITTLSGIILSLDQYELDGFSNCGTPDCESAWDKTFIAPSSQLDDIIRLTKEHYGITKQIKEDENPNLSNLN